MGFAQNDSSSNNVNDTFYIRKNPLVLSKDFVDSLADKTLLRKIFFKNENINPADFKISEIEKMRVVPGQKQVKVIIRKNTIWKFWLILGLCFFVASVRLINRRIIEHLFSGIIDLSSNFDGMIKSNTSFIYSIIQSTLIFLLSLSSAAVLYNDSHKLIETKGHYETFTFVFLGLITIYLVKFIINMMYGSITGMANLARVHIFTTITLNNLTGFIIFPLIIFYAFIDNSRWEQITEVLIIIVLLGNLIYRLFKMAIIGLSQSRYSFIYIIIYLCALEIFPWLVLFKFINDFLS